MIYGQRAAAGQIEPQLTQFFGAEGAKFVQDMVAKASILARAVARGDFVGGVANLCGDEFVRRRCSWR